MITDSNRKPGTFAPEATDDYNSYKCNYFSSSDLSADEFKQIERKYKLCKRLKDIGHVLLWAALAYVLVYVATTFAYHLGMGLGAS